MSRSAFQIRRFLAVLALSAILASVETNAQPAAPPEALEQMQAQIRALETELAHIRAAETTYLILIDEILQMKVVLGQVNEAAVMPNLVETRRILYTQSFTVAQWQALVTDYHAVATAYFERVGAAVASSQQWPRTAPPEQWRAEATRQLQAAWQDFQARFPTLNGTAQPLRNASIVLAWSLGSAELTPNLDFFGGTQARVASAMATLPAGNGRSPAHLRAPAPQGLPVIRASAASPPQSLEPRLAIGRPAQAQDEMAAGERLLNEGHPREALAEFDRMLQQSPNVPRLWLDRGRAINQLGDLTGAVQAYGQALRLQPGMRNIRTWIAELDLASGDLNGARALLVEELRIFPDSAWATSWLGTISLVLNQPQETSRLMADAMRLDPQVALYRYQNAISLGQLGLDQRAITEFRSVLALDPGKTDAYYGLGLHLARLGAGGPAVDAFDRFLQAQPQSPFAAGARQMRDQMAAAQAPPPIQPLPQPTSLPPKQPPAATAGPTPTITVLGTTPGPAVPPAAAPAPSTTRATSNPGQGADADLDGL